MAKIKSIICGHAKNIIGINEGLFQDRIIICRNCDKMKTNLFGEYCSICGCILSAKLREKDQHCPENKWNELK